MMWKFENKQEVLWQCPKMSWCVVPKLKSVDLFCTKITLVKQDLEKMLLCYPY